MIETFWKDKDHITLKSGLFELQKDVMQTYQSNNIDDYLKIRKSLFSNAMKSPLFNTEDFSKSFFESLRKIVQ